MSTRHYYSDTAVTTSLTSGISNSATSLTVASASGFPGSFPYYLSIERLTGSMEVVEVTNGVGTTLTVVRGASSTAAVSHSSGAVVEHVAPALHYNEAEIHINAISGVHGVTGDIVGTSATQTLTNKTMSGVSNTFGNIPESAVTGLVTDITNSTNHIAATTAHGSGSAVVGKDQAVTLTNKTMSGGSNTFSAIPITAITRTAPAVQTFGTNGTVTSASVANAISLRVRVWGSGGAGGGAPATGVGESSCGGGGAAGGYAEVNLAVSALTFPLAITVPAGGTGVAGANGNAGTSATVVDNNGAGATLASAPGGAGGGALATGTSVTTAAGGAATGGGVGDVQGGGSAGQFGLRMAATVARGGNGGDGLGGGGGRGSTGAGVGSAGTGAGAGGGGAAIGASTANTAGGAGAPAQVVVEPIYA